MAVNCCVVPAAICGLAGITAIDTNGLVTVIVAVPEIEVVGSVAMMVTDVLAVTAVARPPDVMEAPVEALQVTLLVMFFVLPSAYVPVAVYCWVAFGARDTVDGVTAMDTSGLVTVNVALPPMEPEVAVIVEVAPTLLPVASPPD